MIRFACDGCGKTINVAATAAGKRGKCPGCGTSVLVPTPAPMPVESRKKSPPPVPPSAARPAPIRASAVPLPPTSPQQSPVLAQAVVAPEDVCASIDPQLRETPGAGIIAGIVAMTYSVLHFIFGGFLCLAASFFNVVSNSIHSANVASGTPKPNPVAESFFGAFQTVQMSLAFVSFIVLTFAIAACIGAIGLFRGAFWGWITTNITVVLALVMIGTLSYSYFGVASSLEEFNDSIEMAAQKAGVSDHPAYQLRMQAQKSVHRRILWVHLLPILFYTGFAMITGIALMNRKVFTAYRQ